MKKLEGISVLVVDDEEEIREIMREVFEECGAIVTEAENGRIALEKFRQIKIDVVMSDVRMPVMDGFTLLKNLRTEFPKIPLFFLVSGHCDTTAEEVKAMGASNIFSKPVRSDVLTDAVLNSLKESVFQAK